MFSFFKKKVPTVPRDAGPTTIDPVKMTLDERKLWRNEMVKKSVVDALAAYEVISGMYRYRICPLDEREHYFIVAIETTRHFAMSKHTSTATLSKMEETIKKIAYNSYGIAVEGVFWKANETVEVFEKVKEYKIPSTRPVRPIHEIAQDFKNTVPGWSDSAYNTRDDEREVNGKTYSTDMAPLGPL